MNRCAIVLVGVLAAGAAARAQTPAPPARESPLTQDLKRLSIEELSELDVTSVSRRVERLSQTAAAVSVVRADDIRRIGSTTLAEAMRLADGLDVARFDGRTWGITARGFNIVTANKLLVLMDGRTLYSPLFSGTFWDVQDTVMADIDRIEVIRGPGGSSWGANAVNGVINIITKDAAETRGAAAVVSAGNENQLTSSVRYGGRAGAGNYRVYGKYRRQGANRFADGTSAEDPLQLGQLGMRFDSAAEATSRWSIQGKGYAGTEALFDRDDSHVRGGFVQGTWRRRQSSTTELQIDADYDYTYRRVPLQFEEGRHTVDFDAQQHTRLAGRHDLVVGGHFRMSTARAVGSGGFLFEPERRTTAVGGVFVQDEIRIAPQVFVTLGSRFEGNDYTGLEISPTARVRWSPGERQTVWGAVSRAARLPTRFDTDLLIRNPAGRVIIGGNPDFESETVVAYEGGYRTRPHDRIALDVAGFVNSYDRLRSQELPSPLGAVAQLGNTLNGTTQGVETSVTAQLLGPWRVRGSYTYLHKRLSADAGSHDVSRGVSEGNDPSFFWSLRSYLDLPHGLALDGMFRQVAERPAPAVPGYSSLDLRLGWSVLRELELSLVGQNLLDSSHPEFGAPTARRYEFERGVYLRSSWRF